MHSLSSASALAVLSFAFNVLGQNVQSCPYTPVWNPCTGNTAYDCATFLVPEDWSDDDRGERPLHLIRIPSSNPDAESIVINPGGPGSSGIKAILGDEDGYYRELAGPDYHIVGFDPRGVGVNKPYNCQDPETGDPGDDYSQQDTIDAAFLYANATATKCDREWGDAGTEEPIGSVISTAQTARDVNAISQKLNSDQMIRYWGFSYGTLLGDTIAKTFPTRISRMVLDGNINPNDYYFQFPVEEATDIDRGVANFFGLCASADVLAVDDTTKGAEGCAWTTPTDADRTNATLLQKFDSWVGADPSDTVDRGRTTNAAGVQLTAIQSYQIRQLMWAVLKDPSSFIKLSQIFQYWYDNPGQIKSLKADDVDDYDIPQPSATATPVRRQVAATGIADTNGNYNPVAGEAAAVGQNELTGITCVDNQYRPGDLDGGDYKSFLDLYNQKTKYAGEMSVQIFYSCAPWLTRSKFPFADDDRFANIKTETPILYVQTTYDPVTPAISGKSASNAFINSYYIESNGAGHCSSAHRSTGLDAAILAYWQSATKPAVTQYTPNSPNPFTTKPITNGPDVDSDGGEQTGDPSEQKRSIAAMWPYALKPRAPGKRQATASASSATLGSCDGTTSSSSSATSGTTTSTTGTSNATTTSTGSSSTVVSSSTASTTSSTTGTVSSATGTVSTSTASTSTVSMGTASTGAASTTKITLTTGTGTTVSTGTASYSGTSSATIGTGSTSITSIRSYTTGKATSYTVSTRDFTTGTDLETATWSKSFTTRSENTYTTSKPYPTGKDSTTSRTTASDSTSNSGRPNPNYKGGSTWTDRTSTRSISQWGNWDPNQSTPRQSTSARATSSWTEWDPKSTSTAWGPWSADDPAYVWQPWTSQVDCVAVTKTFCGDSGNKGSGCSVGVVAVPTKTIYVDWVTDVCETGVTTKIVTVTATCDKGCDSKPTGIPQGFITSKVYCSACAVPSDVIVTVKNPNAPTGKVPGNGNDGNNGKPSEWSDGPAADPVKPADVAGDDWSGWVTATSIKSADPVSGTWSAWNAPASGKPIDPADNTWLGWSTPVAVTAGSSKPANPASASWSAWATAASDKAVDPASNTWSAWATPAAATGTPATGTVDVGSSSWSAWDDPTATGPKVAKYTGGAVGNTVTRGGVLAVVFIALIVL